MALRISGLASGMDTETMVKELMTAHRIPLNKITQKKQYTEWQRDDYRTVNRTLNDFRNLTNDTMLRQSTFIKKTVTSSAPDDVSVKNINSTSDFSGKIKVNQLAESATMQSSDRVLSSEADLTKSLKVLNPALNVSSSFTIKAIKADGTMDTKGYEVKLDEKSTMQSVLDDINKNSGVNAFYDSYTGKIAFTAKNSGDVIGGSEIQFSDNYEFLKVKGNNVEAASKATMQSTGSVVDSDKLGTKLSELGLATAGNSFTIKSIQADGTLDTGYEVIIDENSTMQSVLNAINENSGVNATYDQLTGKITFTAKYGGDIANGNEIEFSGTPPESYAFLKVATNNAGSEPSGTVGKNAKFTYNGLTTERQSNTFQISGFEISLKKANSEEITFSSAPDVDSILGSVTKFVDEYNKLIEDLNTQIRETKYKDYQPLTDQEKESLSEDQIKKWDEKAMSGTLKNDSIITSVLNKMRSAMSSAVGKSPNSISLSQLGITTSKNYLENGKLTIDETKLREAISADPNQVYELFASNGEADSEKGIARRLTKALEEARKSITAKAGSESATVNNNFVLGRLLDGYDSQVKRFEDRLATMESRYWKQFTSMEKAIQQANSQSTYLAGMFNTGS